MKGPNELKKVLVLDSEKTFSKRLEWELAQGACDAVFACDVPGATELIDQRDFDLAVLETNPPDIENSIGLLRKIHCEHPKTEVLMLTDFGDEELWVQVLTEGASDLVPRPALLRELESKRPRLKSVPAE